MAERRGLGRGLGALIRDDEEAMRANAELSNAQSGGTGGGERTSRPVDLYFGGGDVQWRSEISALLSPPLKRGKKDVDSVSRETEESGKGGKRATKARASQAKPAAAGETVSRETGAAGAVAASSEVLEAQRATAKKKLASPCVLERAGDKPTAASPVSRETAQDGRGEVEKASDSAVGAVAGPASGEPDVSRETEEPELVAVPGVFLAMLSPDVIVPNAKQPRQVFVESEVEELAASIREVGLLQPIVVRPLAADDERRHSGRRAGAPEDSDEVIAGEYELIMGERRLRASQLAGLAEVPAIVRSTADEDMLRDALLENLHRAQLNALEEAAAYEQLLREFGCSQEELARRIARSRPHISNTMRLLKLPGTVQRRVAESRISAGHARALLGLPDAEAMEALAERIEAEGLSVRAVEELVAQGDEPAEERREYRPRRRGGEGAFTALNYQLASRFATRVKVTMGARKGKIAIDFRDAEDLERILAVLSPEIGYKAPAPAGDVSGQDAPGA